jgi:Cu+-exporting ATPase
MSLSSVFVLTNALRLRRFRPPVAAARSEPEGSRSDARPLDREPSGSHLEALQEEEASMTTTFEVQEMSCGKCVKHVTQAVQSVEPEAQVAVDLATGKVQVSPSPKDPEGLAKVITDAGYPARVAA